MPAVCGRDVTMARRPKPAKTEPVVTSKCASGRPLLIDSALPTEFRATHSKQTTEKFLTGARTHISIFNFSPFPTQNPAQLIQCRRALIRRKQFIPKTRPGLPHSFRAASPARVFGLTLAQRPTTAAASRTKFPKRFLPKTRLPSAYPFRACPPRRADSPARVFDFTLSRHPNLSPPPHFYPVLHKM